MLRQVVVVLPNGRTSWQYRDEGPRAAKANHGKRAVSLVNAKGDRCGSKQARGGGAV